MEVAVGAMSVAAGSTLAVAVGANCITSIKECGKRVIATPNLAVEAFDVPKYRTADGKPALHAELEFSQGGAATGKFAVFNGEALMLGPDPAKTEPCLLIGGQKVELKGDTLTISPPPTSEVSLRFPSVQEAVHWKTRLEAAAAASKPEAKFAELYAQAVESERQIEKLEERIKECQETQEKNERELTESKKKEVEELEKKAAKLDEKNKDLKKENQDLKDRVEGGAIVPPDSSFDACLRRAEAQRAEAEDRVQRLEDKLTDLTEGRCFPWICGVRTSGKRPAEETTPAATAANKDLLQKVKEGGANIDELDKLAVSATEERAKVEMAVSQLESRLGTMEGGALDGAEAARVLQSLEQQHNQVAANAISLEQRIATLSDAVAKPASAVAAVDGGDAAGSAKAQKQVEDQIKTMGKRLAALEKTEAAAQGFASKLKSLEEQKNQAENLAKELGTRLAAVEAKAAAAAKAPPAAEPTPSTAAAVTFIGSSAVVSRAAEAERMRSQALMMAEGIAQQLQAAKPAAAPPSSAVETRVVVDPGLQQRVAVLETECKKQADDAQAAKQQLSEVANALDLKQSELVVHKEAKEKLEEVAKRLAEDNQQLKRNLDDVIAKATSGAAAEAPAAAATEALQVEIQNLTSRLAEAESRAQQLDEKDKANQQTIRDAEKKKAMLKKEFEDEYITLRNDVAQEKKAVADEKRMRTIAEEEREALRQQVSMLNDTVQRSIAETQSDMQSKLAAATAAKQAAEAGLAEAEARLQQQRQSMDSQTAQMQSLAQGSEALTKRLQEAEAAASEAGPLKATVAQLQGELANLQSQVSRQSNAAQTGDDMAKRLEQVVAENTVLKQELNTTWAKINQQSKKMEEEREYFWKELQSVQQQGSTSLSVPSSPAKDADGRTNAPLTPIGSAVAPVGQQASPTSLSNTQQTLQPAGSTRRIVPSAVSASGLQQRVVQPVRSTPTQQQGSAVVSQARVGGTVAASGAPRGPAPVQRVPGSGAAVTRVPVRTS
mmetsp:Transcript_55197/g.131554  ORF Transcript_55197/g.131554 Transcript_55197/m.131554 type:complete len:1007 (-) Transcript_55197:94-3114(-)